MKPDHATIPSLRSIAHNKAEMMLKAKDLALLRLRNDTARYSPELAARHTIDPVDAREEGTELVAEEEALVLGA